MLRIRTFGVAGAASEPLFLFKVWVELGGVLVVGNWLLEKCTHLHLGLGQSLKSAGIVKLFGNR